MTDHAGPGLHLALPVAQGGEGGHNQEGPRDVAQLALKLQCADGLCSLAQPHLHGMRQLLHPEYFMMRMCGLVVETPTY